MGKSVWDTIAPILGGAAGTLIAPGIGTAIGAGIGSGVNKGVETGSPWKGLETGTISGLGTYAGGQLAGNVLGSETASNISGQLGMDGALGAANSTPASLIGSASNSLGPTVANALGSSTIGSTAGSALGGKVASNFSDSMFPNPVDPVAGFSPTRTDPGAAPGSFSQFAGLPQDQLTSNIANKGVYGGGNSPDESKYFLNLVNNQLVDPNGKVGDMSSLSPIESSYLAQLGLGGYGNSTDLLKGISNYNA